MGEEARGSNSGRIYKWTAQEGTTVVEFVSGGRDGARGSHSGRIYKLTGQEGTTVV